MNADLEAAIAEGRRRMKQFEEKTAHQLDMFDREVDDHHHKLGHKYSKVTEDLRPVSMPLWGVVLETSDGHKIYNQHAPFDVVSKCPRHCNCTSSLSSPSRLSSAYMPPPPLEEDFYGGSSSTGQFVEGFTPSIEARTIMEGRKWGSNRYVHDEEYVSNAPYGIIMKKPVPKPAIIQEDEFSGSGLMTREQPNTRLVSNYWRRKWKIPRDW